MELTIVLNPPIPMPPPSTVVLFKPSIASVVTFINKTSERKNKWSATHMEGGTDKRGKGWTWLNQWVSDDMGQQWEIAEWWSTERMESVFG